MINLFKNHYLKLFLLILLVGFGLIFWFKGIHITTINNNKNEQHQNQNQLSINLFISRGDVSWTYKKIVDGSVKAFCLEKSKLPPEQSYFAHSYIEEGFFNNKYYLIYPEFSNK